MTPALLLVHGWGFDANFWLPMQAALAGVETIVWNLGFLGPPAKPDIPLGRSVIAVGHSYGLLWLLHHRPVTWQALVSINGFTKFAATDDFPDGVEARSVARMADGLGKDAMRVVTNFRARCGAEAPILSPQVPPLAIALNDLQEWDMRPHQVDLALCGEHDPIVPPAMSRACFDQPPPVWHEGGHLLPQTAPVWCASKISALWGGAL